MLLVRHRRSILLKMWLLGLRLLLVFMCSGAVFAQSRSMSMGLFEFVCKGLAWFVFALVCLVVVLFYLSHRNGNYPSDEG